MKAVVVTKYGSPDVLKLRDEEKPIPNNDEILIKVRAVSVSMGDCEMRGLKLPFILKFLVRLIMGFKKPRKTMILGQEVAGIVEAVGKNVAKFKTGDEIFGQTGFSMGGYAEYAKFSKKSYYIIKPAEISFELAAVLPVGGFNSLHFLRKANIQEGQKVLINGAGGSIGSIAVQLAKFYGANVTAVDSSEKMEMLSSIGADQVIDYTKVDFTKSGTVYDVIFDVVGKAFYSGCIRSLKKNGYFLIANPRFKHLISKRWTKIVRKKTIIAETVQESIEDLNYLTQLVKDGKLKPIIDKTYALENIVDAHKYVETGHKKGNVVISIDQ